MINEILLRRKDKLWITGRIGIDSATKTNRYLVTIMKNLESYGYTMDKDLCDFLFRTTPAFLSDFYNELIRYIKALTGADKVYNPMYPNFPQQVMDADTTELFWNAIIHYWSGGTLMPEYTKDERFPLIDNPDLKVLTLGNFEDLIEIFKNLLSSKTNISAQDKSDIEWIMLNTSSWEKYLPDEIPLKENVAFFGKLVAEKNLGINLSKYYHTATDVLRLVVALSDGDISLALPTKFRKLRRPERRMIMNLLLNCGNILEDMFKYQNEWIRIGEVVHPGEFAKKFSKYQPVFDAFDKLRKNDKPLFFGGKVHNALNKSNIEEAAEILMERPGEFARLLDKLLRDAKYPWYIIDLWRNIAKKVSVPVLLQVKYHFLWRVNPDEYRVIFPKGNTATATVLKNNLNKIDVKSCLEIASICDDAIKFNLAEREPLGNVYVDPELNRFVVPFSQRSASSANKLITRGSTFNINKSAKAIRGFIWWTNMRNSGRVDIDLSAAMFDDDWRFISHVSWTSLRNKSMKVCHSGDITNGGSPNGDGVAEFIDFDIEAVAARCRYVVFQIYSYTGQKYSELPNCRFGWMEREDVNSGEIFEPKTVALSMDVRADSTVAIPVIFDCKERKIIWCDMNCDIKSTGRFCNAVENNVSNINFTCYAMTHMYKPMMSDLAILNAEARGNIVHSRDEADIIFSNDTTKPITFIEEMVNDTTLVKREVEKDVPIITAFDLDYWMGQMM